ncbi:MAG: DUF2304 domain-containing protein [Lachnospiraceae bacterium]
MISSTLQYTLIAVLIYYFATILLFLKKKSISLKYTLLWIFSGCFMGALVIWPELLLWIVKLVGIESEMNGLFVIAIGFIMVILMSITSIVSKQSEKIRLLTQEIAILEKRVRELEEK